MRVVIAADHAGLDLKEHLLRSLVTMGHDVMDLGTRSREPVDYPDYAEAVGVAILKGAAERGILLCGSGVGASIAANKIPGIRAGLCHDSYSAHQGVEHDAMNVLVLGARVIGFAAAEEFARSFLDAVFVPEERYLRRLQKVSELEKRALQIAGGLRADPAK